MARKDVFTMASAQELDAKQRELAELLGAEEPKGLELTAPFDTEDIEAAFVEQYCAASKEERQDLMDRADEVIEQSETVKDRLDERRAELKAGVLQTQRAAIELAQSLPVAAESIVAANEEAGVDEKTAVTTAANIEGVVNVEVADEDMAELVKGPYDAVIAYAERVDAIRASNTNAVSAREAAERAAAAPAPAPTPSPQSSGGFSQGLCNR